MSKSILDRYNSKFSELKNVVEQQSEDDALWVEVTSIVEAYLQNALRELHYMIENFE